MCPLNFWCDKCANCEFDYDDLKRNRRKWKLQQSVEENECNDFNAILEEKKLNNQFHTSVRTFFRVPSLCMRLSMRTRYTQAFPNF